VKFEHWVDTGYPQKSNGLKSETELQKFFDNCDTRSCRSILKHKYFYCTRIITPDRIGYCQITKDDYFDLDAPTMNKKEFLEFALGFSNKGYVNYCRKCNGTHNVNLNKIPAGLQL